VFLGFSKSLFFILVSLFSFLSTRSDSNSDNDTYPTNAGSGLGPNIVQHGGVEALVIIFSFFQSTPSAKDSE